MQEVAPGIIWRSSFRCTNRNFPDFTSTPRPYRCRRNVHGEISQTPHSHCYPGFWEKFSFTPGDLGYPIFATKFAKVGVYICYDRHFPEGARALGLNGAEIVFNPSARLLGSQSIYGSWSNQLTPWPTAILSERSTVWAKRNPGASASSTAKVISAIRAGDRRPGQPGQRRSAGHRSRSGHDPGSKKGLAIFPRPPAGEFGVLTTQSGKTLRALSCRQSLALFSCPPLFRNSPPDPSVAFLCVGRDAAC